MFLSGPTLSFLLAANTAILGNNGAGIKQLAGFDGDSADVAVAAWRFIEGVEGGGTDNNATLKKLRAALDYLSMEITMASSRVSIPWLLLTGSLAPSCRL